jgi:hypothetical protein
VVLPFGRDTSPTLRHRKSRMPCWFRSPLFQCNGAIPVPSDASRRWSFSPGSFESSGTKRNGERLAKLDARSARGDLRGCGTPQLHRIEIADAPRAADGERGGPFSLDHRAERAASRSIHPYKVRPSRAHVGSPKKRSGSMSLRTARERARVLQPCLFY